MKVFKYWIKENFEINLGNKKFKKLFYSGSNISEQDAREKIQIEKPQLIQSFIEFAQKKREKRISGFREYDSNIVEPLIKDVSDGSLKAYITRNHYGSEVLCVDKMMFLDIDYANVYFKEEFFPKHKRMNLFLKFFGIKTQSFLSQQKTIEAINNELNVITQEYKTIHETETKIIYVLNLLLKNKYKNLGFKIYRTRMGLRLIETTQLWNPKSEEVWAIMKDFMCDNVYMLFCLRQNCFRARLTPKPWRVKMEAVNVAYPFNSDEDKLKYEDWIEEYNKKKYLKNVSELFCSIGNQHINDEFKQLIELHNNYHLFKDKPLG